MPSLTLPAVGATAATAGAAATTATVGSGIAAGGATGIAGASSLAAASLPAITGISTASVPVAGATAATAAAPSLLTSLATAAVPATVGLGANLLMQPPKPAPAPNMPDISSIFGRTRQAAGGQLGGTFLTQGKTLGSTGGGGKTLLGS